MGLILMIVGIAAAVSVLIVDAAARRILFLGSADDLMRAVGIWALVFLPAALVAIVSRVTARRRGAHRTLAPMVSGAIVAALMALALAMRL